MNAGVDGRGGRAAAWTHAVVLALTMPLALLADNGLVISVGLLALWFVADCLRRRRWPAIRQRALVATIALLLAWGAVTWFWSLDPALTTSRLGHLLLAAVAGWLALALTARQAAAEGYEDRLADAAAVAMALSAALVVGHALSGGVLLEWLTGKTPHPDRMIALSRSNNGAALLAIWSMPTLVLVRRHRGLGLALALAGFAAIAILISESLAAKLALLLSALVFALARTGKTVSRVFGALMALACFALPGLALLTDKPFAALRQALAQIGLVLPETAAHRVYIYDFVLQRIWERPLAGFGLGTSRVLPGGDEKIPELGRVVLPMHPHNVAFELWVELGAVGGALLALVVALIAAAAVRHAEASARAAALATLCAYLTLGMLSYSQWSSWWLAGAFLSGCFVLSLCLNSRPG